MAKAYQAFCVIDASLIPLSIAHTKSFILSRSIIILLTIPTYDYDQRHWKKIYSPEETNELNRKLRELFTGIPADEIAPVNNKPTVRIRRTSSLKAASVRYHEEDRAEKVLRLLTGNI